MQGLRKEAEAKHVKAMEAALKNGEADKTAALAAATRAAAEERAEAEALERERLEAERLAEE